MRSLAHTLSAGLILFGCEDETLIAGASLEVDPPAIDFGKVPAGRTRSVDLTLRSRSAAELQIRSLTVAEGSAPVFSLGDVPDRIAGAEEARVRVSYAPDDAEPDAGHLEILTNAIDGARVLVPLTSARTSPRIEVRPGELDLGSAIAGGEASGSIEVTSAGDATLAVTRASLRTLGFLGEVCLEDADCREGRCTDRVCCEDTCGTPPLERRGFAISSAIPSSLLPEESTEIGVTYRPSATDRGSVTLVIESDDRERPLVLIPLHGLLENLPPIAVAAFASEPGEVGPGSHIEVTGRDSFDPEGSAVEHRWRFVSRSEGSRAAFEDAAASDTAFAIDRPGLYVVGLEARDASGLTSTNDARLEVLAGAGERVRVELSWDRAGTDLDLHLVSPGAPVGSLGDCFYDNPRPDWPEGDPIFTQTSTTETIAVEEHADGVYTILVDVVAASPQGPTGADVRLFLDDVEVARFEGTLPSSADAWDVATISWPTGRIVALDTIR
jgi:hypothetical protein